MRRRVAADTTRPTWTSLLGAVLSAAALLLGPGCTNGERHSNGQHTATDPKPAAVRPGPPQLRIVAITDLQGYLEPCGCQKRPLGGIDRASSEIAKLRSDGVPTLILSAGDLLFEAADSTDHADHPQGGETQEIWKAEVLADILKRLGTGASLLGAADARFGVELRDKLVERGGLRTLRGEGAQAVARLNPGGIPVGVWGARMAEANGDPARLAQQATEHARKLRADGARLVIGLIDGEAREVRRLAGRVAGTDLILNGGLRRPEPEPPARVGNVTVLGSGQHGRGLLVVDVHVDGEGPLADASLWTLDYRRKAHQETIDDLKPRIAAWKKEADVDAKQLAQQQARLERLQNEAAAMSRPSAVSGRRFDARYVELSPEVEKDAATTDVMSRYDKRVNEHNRTAFADHRPPPVEGGAAHYIGSEACGTCHAPALGWWRGHPHGHAYATLQKRHKEFNLSCVGCHVTGYEQPGGSTVTHNQGLTNVGCESCHGPGSLHQGNKEHITRAPDASVCVQCHNAEHSDAFDFELYRSQLIVAGHGKPVEAATPP